jgi:predicted ArsR family transcriptional regulator
MPVPRVKLGSLKGTRGKVLDLLRRSDLTANEIAARLELTHNAVRGHLAALHREGLIREGGSRRSGTRPAVVYALAPEADAVFSRAYIPFVAHLVRTLQEKLEQKDLDDIMQNVGRSLAADWPRARGELPKRVQAASELLEDLGALNEIERLDGGFVIRGYGCVLSQAVHRRPEICRAMERLLAELVEAPVRECCERGGDRPLCCFQIGVSDRGTTRGAPTRTRGGAR